MKARKWLFIVGLILLASTWAAADTTVYTITLAGTGSNVQGGVYVAPYYLTVNNGPQLTVICDSYYNEVYKGQTWNGVINTFPDLSNTLFGQSMTAQAAAQVYTEAGWLYTQYIAHPNQAGDINFAIWALFSNITGPPPVSGWTSGAQNWLDAANAWYGNSNNSGAITAIQNALVIYTPSDLSGKALSPTAAGTPQEYIRVVPEPSTPAMLGLGLIGMAGIFRRKLLV